MKTIAVLMTCHNRREKTISSLQSLFQNILSENYVLDVYLVDDGSTDGTSEAVKTEFPKVNIVQGNGNLYWNRGMILAWEMASKTRDFDFYLWLNDDTILKSGSINLFLEHAHQFKNNCIYVGATCSAKNNFYTYGGYKRNSKMVIPNGEWQECDYFNGNMVLIPSLIFSKIGYLDKKFKHGLGDFDYGRRAKQKGFQLLMSPEYIGYCEGHEKVPLCYDKNYNFFSRLKHLYSPLGNNPFEFYILDKRQNGILTASFHFITIHIRAILPQLWKKQNKKTIIISS